MTEFNKSFIQGIITATIETNNENTLPMKQLNVLKNLVRNTEIHITPSEKGGGIIIINMITYREKTNKNKY